MGYLDWFASSLRPVLPSPPLLWPLRTALPHSSGPSFSQLGPVENTSTESWRAGGRQSGPRRFRRRFTSGGGSHLAAHTRTCMHIHAHIPARLPQNSCHAPVLPAGTSFQGCRSPWGEAPGLWSRPSSFGLSPRAIRRPTTLRLMVSLSCLPPQPCGCGASRCLEFWRILLESIDSMRRGQSTGLGIRNGGLTTYA